MALPLSLQVFDAGPQRAQPVSRHNVIPFPSSRVQLPVTLLGVSEDDARRRLLEIKQKIEQGGDFAAFARSFSQDASASQGGDLGWVSPGETVPDFERAMNALQPGQISDPVRTEYGYHLIEVIGRRQQKVTAEQDQDAARQAIGTRKSDQAYDDWLRQLRDTAYIQYKIGGPPADSQQAATN